MCNAYKVAADLAAIGEALAAQFGLDLVLAPGVTAQTSNLVIPQDLFPRREGLILRPADPARPEAGLEPALAHWNLTPAFHIGGPKAWKASTNNCRAETAATAPAFRGAFRHRRCLVPATSFTEWTGPKGSKTAHAISRVDGGLLVFAGLWEHCATDEGPVDSYTVLTLPVASEDDMARFHTRQPAILDREGVALWLDLTGEPELALRAPPRGTLVFDPPEPATIHAPGGDGQASLFG